MLAMAGLYPFQQQVLDKFKGRGVVQLTGRNAGKSTLEDQIADELGKQMQQEIDREVLWGMLEGLGWTRVMLPRLIDNNHAVDITYWLEANCKFAYERSGRDFMFESVKDANWFKMRWMS